VTLPTEPGSGTFAYPAPPLAAEALLTTDDGQIDAPLDEADWADWVAATDTSAYLDADPLLDWLNLYGVARGFVRDDRQPGYAVNLDLDPFLEAQGQRFEAGILAILEHGCRSDGRTLLPEGYRDTTGQDIRLVRIAGDQDGARSLEAAYHSAEAMLAGAPLIAGATLRNPENRTYGIADLLIRSDVLEQLFPGTLSPAEASLGAPGLARDGRSPAWHYRVVDIKFRTLELVASGHLSTSMRRQMAQVWVYNEALGRLQGYTPEAAYLLGRAWKQGQERGISALERLGRVDRDFVLNRRVRSRSDLVGPDEQPLAELVDEAIAWVRRVRHEGDTWQVLPVPSVPELFPHARNANDAPWHRAKGSIASALAELTLLPGVSPRLRRRAAERGLVRWDQPNVSAANLGVANQFVAACDGVLAANRRIAEAEEVSLSGNAAAPAPVVLPARISRIDPAWRTPAPLECYVDFETVSSLADDFATLPLAGGQPLIFQIGCAHYEPAGPGEVPVLFSPSGAPLVKHFAQWTAERLNEPSEAVIIEAWLAHMFALAAKQGLALERCAVIHWSPAESSSLESAYNSARIRHTERARQEGRSEPDWPALPWFDFLTRVVRAEPVTLRGAFNFGLKSVAGAAHAQGLIRTLWSDGPSDGLGAMVGAWRCEEACVRREARSLREQPLMASIAAYNEVDCTVMGEFIAWLRINR
jgi:hypothetical protein